MRTTTTRVSRTTTRTISRTRATTTEHARNAAGRLTSEAAGARLSELFEEHGRMVYGVCRLLLRDREDAEDASQQTFLSAHRSMLGGTEPDDPAAWLGTIARNECRERIRARMTAPLALVGDPAATLDVESVAGGHAEIEALCSALAELPDQQREAIVLREFYGLSYEEVRAALGVTDSAVESLIFRARRRLQEELRPARVASGALVLPLALRDSIAAAIPGFGGAEGTGMIAKLASLPIAAKLAAAALTVTVAGTVGTTALESHGRAAKPDPPAAVHPRGGASARGGGVISGAPAVVVVAGRRGTENERGGSDDEGPDARGGGHETEQREDARSGESGESGESGAAESRSEDADEGSSESGGDSGDSGDSGGSD